MAEVHRLLESQGKKGALEANAFPRDVIEAAALYMAEEDTALAFAYSGWAQCALPHRRIPVDQPWEVRSDSMSLVVEPGRRHSGAHGEGPLEIVGVPFGGRSGRAVREQAELLSRCRMSFHFHGRGRAGLVNQSIVDRALFIHCGNIGTHAQLENNWLTAKRDAVAGASRLLPP
jgi:hypothetical protein